MTPPKKPHNPKGQLIIIIALGLIIGVLLAGILITRSSSGPTPLTRSVSVTTPVPTTVTTPIQTTVTLPISPTIGTSILTTETTRQVTTLPTPKPAQKSVFSQAAVEYFIDEFGGYVQKWTRNPIPVEIRGNPDSESLSCVNTAITEINQLSSQTKLRVGSISDSGIVIQFAPRSELRALYPEKVADGLTQTQVTYGCEIKLAAIWINNNSELDSVKRCTIIRHELLHGLGFEGHTQQFRNSIMYAGYPFITSYSVLDREIISMMYSTDIPPCANESDVRAYFS